MSDPTPIRPDVPTSPATILVTPIEMEGRIYRQVRLEDAMRALGKLMDGHAEEDGRVVDRAELMAMKHRIGSAVQALRDANLSILTRLCLAYEVAKVEDQRRRVAEQFLGYLAWKGVFPARWDIGQDRYTLMDEEEVAALVSGFLEAR